MKRNFQNRSDTQNLNSISEKLPNINSCSERQNTITTEFKLKFTMAYTLEHYLIEFHGHRLKTQFQLASLTV